MSSLAISWDLLCMLSPYITYIQKINKKKEYKKEVLTSTPTPIRIRCWKENSTFIQQDNFSCTHFRNVSILWLWFITKICWYYARNRIGFSWSYLRNRSVWVYLNWQHENVTFNSFNKIFKPIIWCDQTMSMYR